MKGEEQLINLMHCRYMQGVQDMVIMLGGDPKTVEINVMMANRLSDLNVEYYKTKWGRKPNPQKILIISQENNIVSTDKWLPLRG